MNSPIQLQSRSKIVNDWEEILADRYGLKPGSLTSVLIFSDLSAQDYYDTVLGRSAVPPRTNPSIITFNQVNPATLLSENFAAAIRSAGLVVVDLFDRGSLSRKTARYVEYLTENANETVLAVPALSSRSAGFGWIDSERFCGWIAEEGLIKKIFSSLVLRKLRGSRWRGDVATYHVSSRRPTVNLIFGSKGKGKSTRYDIELKSGAIGVSLDRVFSKLDHNLNKNCFSKELITHIERYKQLQEEAGRTPRLLRSQESFAKYIVDAPVLEEFFYFLTGPVLEFHFNYVFEGGVLTDDVFRSKFKRYIEKEKKCIVWVSFREPD